MKKSFLIHIDSLDVLDDLSDEQSGELFNAIKAYHNNEEITLSPIVKIAFSPFRNQFKRDNEKYIKLCEKNKLIAENRYKNKPTKSTTRNEPKRNATKSTDNDKDSDSDNDKDSDNTNVEFDLVWSMYEKKGNRKTSLSRFNKLKDSDKQKMSIHLPKYVKSTPDKQFRKALESYINLECWNDEILEVSNGQRTEARIETTADRYASQSRELQEREARARGHEQNTIPLQNNG